MFDVKPDINECKRISYMNVDRYICFKNQQASQPSPFTVFGGIL